LDAQTIHAYNSTAGARCECYRLILPTELLLFAPGFFHPGQPTADIGCGSGRDVAWLNEHGFPSIGYDASPAMLAEARTAYPGIDVRAAALPKLASVPYGAYANVLCSVVLMHLPRKDLGRAVRSLARILQPGGGLLLSYRSSAAAAEREADGRLFTAISPGELTLQLDAAGLRVSKERQQADAYRPSVRWFILLAEKQPFLGATSEDAVHSALSRH
jgi:SAM-dependent methyltransferase